MSWYNFADLGKLYFESGWELPTQEAAFAKAQDLAKDTSCRNKLYRAAHLAEMARQTVELAVIRRQLDDIGRMLDPIRRKEYIIHCAIEKKLDEIHEAKRKERAAVRKAKKAALERLNKQGGDAEGGKNHGRF